MQGLTAYTTASDGILSVACLLLGLALGHILAFCLLKDRIDILRRRLVPVSIAGMAAAATCVVLLNAFVIYAYWVYSAGLMVTVIIASAGSRGWGKSITVATLLIMFSLGFVAMLASFVAR
jgi:hypothetical protein